MNEDKLNENNVILYRLDRLEEAVNKLSALTDIVTRWDARFQAQGGLMQCGVHQTRMDGFDKKLDEIYKITTERTRSYLLIEEHETKMKIFEEEIERLKSYMNKAIGALVIISIVVQLFTPFVTDFLKNHSHAPVVMEQTEPGFNFGSITNR